VTVQDDTGAGRPQVGNQVPQQMSSRLSSAPTASAGPGSPRTLETAATLRSRLRIAGHESTRITQLYNRVREEASLDEIKRILIVIGLLISLISLAPANGTTDYQEKPVT